MGKILDLGYFSGSDYVFYRIAYIYPDFRTALVGSFVDGFLEEARPTTLRTVIDDRGMKIPIFNECQDKVYKRDISDYDHVTYDPLLRDPYETKMVDVRQSAVEGTFKILPANFLI